MLNETAYTLGSNRSCIRELFEYGLRQAAVVGKENVYDFSLGNPSIPAPEEWRTGRGDLLRPSIGGTDADPIIQENQPNTHTVIIEGEMKEDEGIKLFLLN